MRNVHLWVKLRYRALLPVVIAISLVGCVRGNPAIKNGTPEAKAEVDALLNTYDGKSIPATGAEISKYAGQIKEAIEKQFYLPSQYSGKVCTLRIKMAPDGLLLDVQIVDGDPELCRAALEAVKKAEFPKPPSPAVYEVFKNSPLDFMP
ncbi:cell envelope integrity protein TolA [Salmonella enterica]|nr:cell envelope integrity protein TolA [Salmonella enterica]EJJ0090681.1 cell envelope integrity protein TolA [Salmonella enterica]EJJ0104589.1 cell envelope integrity protein TolA [Salmonella enterica]EJJ3876559.1 cell envelope integrity protein TolA [Salmonella enterica]EJJ4043442.1 cell envelope integrity protein TolA [Salmonella enterica]